MPRFDWFLYWDKDIPENIGEILQEFYLQCCKYMIFKIGKCSCCDADMIFGYFVTKDSDVLMMDKEIHEWFEKRTGGCFKGSIYSADCEIFYLWYIGSLSENCEDMVRNWEIKDGTILLLEESGFI